MTLDNLKIKPLSKSNFAPYGQVIELKNDEKLRRTVKSGENGEKR